MYNMKINKNIIIIASIIIAVLLFQYTDLFTVSVAESQKIQYYNKPIEATFAVSNFTNPTITAYFNDAKLYTADYFELQNITESKTYSNRSICYNKESSCTEVLCESTNGTWMSTISSNSTYLCSCPVDSLWKGEYGCNNNISIIDTYTVNETFYNVKVYPNISQSFVYSYISSNGSYTLKLTNLSQEGTLKFEVKEGLKTEAEVVEVRAPFVKAVHDIPESVNRDTRVDVTVTTYNPQGESISADQVKLIISAPNSVDRTVLMEKQGNSSNVFTASIVYDEYGLYTFKIQPSYFGYKIGEFEALTNVIKTEGIHPIVWVWTGAAGLFILLLLIKFLGKRK